MRVHPDIIGTVPLTSVVHEDQIGSAKIRAVADFVAEIVERDRRLLEGISRGGTARL